MANNSSLTPEMISYVKDSLREDAVLRANVCARIAVDTVFTNQYESIAHGLSDLRVKPEDLIYAACVEAAGRAMHLDAALELPGTEWPESITQPGKFLSAYEAVQEDFFEHGQGVQAEEVGY